VRNKRWLHETFRALAETQPDRIGTALAEAYHPDAEWRGSHPINELSGTDQIEHTVWQPLIQSFPDLERRDVIVVGGTFEGRDYVATVGHYCGTFREDWLSIPSTGRPIYIRYGEVHEIRDGRIVQSNCLWDILDVIRQAGFWPIAPSLGTEGMWPGPLTADGLMFAPSDPEQSRASISQTLAMHKTLGDYNDLAAGRDGLLAMPQKQHWHPRMMWYGPSGIGTTRGLQGFVDYHQLPFRTAFPNRKGGGQWGEAGQDTPTRKGGHYIRIGDGPYSVTGGWPSVFAMHLGNDFAGVGATGRPVTMRVMDFYLHHEGLIRENWVPLDMLDLLLQMGVDVMARMQSHFKRGRLPQ
jgi:predicted ester cyclase